MISFKSKLFISLTVSALCWMLITTSLLKLPCQLIEYRSPVKRNHTVNPELNSYLNIILKPFELCKKNRKEKFVFIYVFVAIGSFEKRDIIRQTWANKNIAGPFQVAFIIGRSVNPAVNALALKEHHKHNDLIQGNLYIFIKFECIR